MNFLKTHVRKHVCKIEAVCDKVRNILLTFTDGDVRQ